MAKISMANRDIKFRVWKGNKFKKIPQELVGNRCAHLCMKTEQTGDFCAFVLESTDGKIFQEFTGSLDKNGKEIYEGDICKIEGGLQPLWAHQKDATYLIERDDWGFVFKILKGNHMFGAGFFEDKRKNVEVIGNLFENPDLLS